MKKKVELNEHAQKSGEEPGADAKPSPSALSGVEKWTPGPWTWRQLRTRQYLRGQDASFINISTDIPDKKLPRGIEAQAVNNLIAAAPDLYAFVERQNRETYCICKLNAIARTDVPCTHCETAALMAKARGESDAE